MSSILRYCKLEKENIFVKQDKLIGSCSNCSKKCKLSTFLPIYFTYHSVLVAIEEFYLEMVSF